MTEADQLAYNLVNTIKELHWEYRGRNFPDAKQPNLYLGREERRTLLMADDRWLRLQWGPALSPGYRDRFMAMPVFGVDAENHLNVG